jgi:hypothetical protein
MAEKNLFLIARRGREGDENQLTELLAYLWQEQPDLVGVWLGMLDLRFGLPAPWSVDTQGTIPSGRRPDMWVEKPGEALVLVESKLGSSEGLCQLRDYATYLAGRASDTPLRMLVFLTQYPQGDFSRETRKAAEPAGVALVHTRWQSMTAALEGNEAQLVQQFETMLKEEKLVKPPAFTGRDWNSWGEGSVVAIRLGEFQDEIRPRMEKLAAGHKKTGPLSLGARFLYRIYSFDGFQVALAFDPGKWQGLGARVGVICLNDELEPADRRRHATKLIEQRVADWAQWGEWPGISADVEDVLTSGTLDEQEDQAIEFVRSCLASFRESGYLPTASSP